MESYSIENNKTKCSHLLTVRANGADPSRPPNPYGEPDCKISVFFTTSLRDAVQNYFK